MMQNDIYHNLFCTAATIHQVKLNKYEPNCTKAEHIIPTAMAVLQHSTYKNPRRSPEGRVAEAKCHHHHGSGVVPRRKLKPMEAKPTTATA
jgi:hypothetical protein